MEGRSWKIGVMAEARHADAFNEDGCARDECTRAERRRHEGAKRTTESQHSGFAASRVGLIGRGGGTARGGRVPQMEREKDGS